MRSQRLLYQEDTALMEWTIPGLSDGYMLNATRQSLGALNAASMNLEKKQTA